MSFWNKLLGAKEFPAEAVPQADKDALESAFYWRQVEKVKALLKRSPALVHSQTESGQTVLHLAAKVTDKDIAKLALARGINVNVRDKWGNTPLHEAAKHADMSVLKLLLDNEADFSMKTDDGSTPLHCAAVNGHTSVVELLLAKGADVDAKNNAGDTPLHLSVPSALLDSITRVQRASRRNLMKLLLAKKADTKAKDRSGRTPLDLAMSNGHEDLAELLRENGG